LWLIKDRVGWRDLISGPISHPEKELRRKRRRYKNSTAAKDNEVNLVL